jgi:hypothetical protein
MRCVLLSPAWLRTRMRKLKTLEDFPHFIVSAIRRGKTSDNGYTRFELDGKFDGMPERIDQMPWFWLLDGLKDCLCATLQSLDRKTRIAILTCDEKDETEFLGETLTCLNPYWQAFHIWMVLDPAWGWKEERFQGADAVAEDYVSGGASIEDGREVRVWTKLEPAEGRKGMSRHCPVSDQNSPPSSQPRLVAGGWDHQHFELCRAHIDAGSKGHCDPGGRWMCTKCFEKYVIPRDLVFVDEL